MAAQKVAIITGGASGIGMTVARALAKKQWALHIFDFDEKNGNASAEELSKSTSATFHKVDVSSWESQSWAFDRVFKSTKRLDFVYANAGIFETENFFALHDTDGPPPQLKWPGIDINLKGLIDTSYLAQHYFRQDGRKSGTLIFTASCVGLYPSQHTPRYSATKGGVLNFMRAIAPAFYTKHGIRVSAVLPGAVKTNFLAENDWPPWPESYFTPTSLIASTVERLLAGGALEDAWGQKRAEGETNGLAVEVNCDKIYFRDQPEFCDDIMRTVMGDVTVEARGK
ncbi:15-hydroxyprostaglandin dehydrogenase [Xylariales sp. PMI_506]|nr:15-hydroxyprostaglandin dehydrogenase [Xylariales sp. PMI_506]